MADAVEGGVEIARAKEAHGALAEFAARDDLGFQTFVKGDAFAGAHFAAGPDQRLPVAAIGGDGAQQEDLDRAAEKFVALGVVLSDGEGVDVFVILEEQVVRRIVPQLKQAGAYSIVEFALNCVEFFRNESCGKCVPCRVGSQKLVDLGDELLAGRSSRERLGLVNELAEAMERIAGGRD